MREDTVIARYTGDSLGETPSMVLCLQTRPGQVGMVSIAEHGTVRIW